MVHQISYLLAERFEVMSQHDMKLILMRQIAAKNLPKVYDKRTPQTGVLKYD